MDTDENRGEINTEANRACRITPSKEGTVHGSCRLQYLSKPRFSHAATETNENCNRGQKWDGFGYWECWKSAAHSAKGRGTMTYSKTRRHTLFSEFFLLKNNKKKKRQRSSNKELLFDSQSQQHSCEHSPFQGTAGTALTYPTVCVCGV